ncbi:NUDIX hydrolase [bacterium]|nr:NUDIX hydrolase [bacterium]
MTDPEITRIDTRVVYKNRWMRVREDRVRRPNGDHGLFGVVEKPDFALIVPFDGENFYLVQQYRYPVDGRFWEFPQGSLELSPEATPEQVATAELAEETGLTAGSMSRLGKLYQAYGYSNQAVNIFKATELSKGAARLSSEEQGLVSDRFSRNEINRMIKNADICDLATISALHLFDQNNS